MYTEPTIILPDAPADILIPEPRIVRPSATIAASRGPLIKIPRVKWERDPAMSELIDHFDEPGRFHDNKKIKTDADRYQLLTVAEIQTIQTIAGKCRDDFSYASRNFFWITNKRRGEQLFRLWESQELIYEHLLRLKAKGMLLKIMILKARQLGCSTLIEGLIAWKTMFFKNVNAIVVSFDPEHAAHLFGIMQYIYDRMPWWLKPQCSSREYKDGLRFENPDENERRRNPGLNSQISVQAANKRTGVGQGTRISAAHLSEYSDWNQDYAREVIEEDLGNALAEDDPDMFAILESTAKGTGNYSYTLWKKNIELAENAEWYPLFLPFFFESTRFIAPAAGWRPEQAETDMRERVKVDWLRCNNRDCLQYHERFHKIEDMSETPCPTCGTGVLYPFELSDGQLRWMQRKRKNAEKDLDSLKKLRQEMCCVTGDARLSTDQGIIRFDEAREIRVVDTGAVTAWLAKGIKPVGEIATKRGRSIKTTHDHQIALTDGRWVEAKDLVTGDRIVMAKPVFASDYFTIRWNVTPYVESSLRVDEAFGRALGYYMGDGCWKGGGIYIACDLKDTDVIDDVKAVLERVSGVRCVTEVRGGMELVNSNSVKWLEVMTAIGGLRKNNGKPNQERLRRVPAGFSYMRKVCVPDCIWRSPRSVVKEFLSALFECDAHAYKESPKTTFFTKWEGFARDVQLLLLGFGINARISHEDKVNGEGRTYIGRAVIFTQEASNIFHRDIGFIGNRKRTTGCVKEEGKYTKGRALFRNEMYDEFVSFTPCGEEEVYDLTVPGAACFGANGMLVHNSTAIEAFQTSGIQVFGEAAQEFANHCVRPPKKEGFLDKAGKMHSCNPYNRRLNSATGDYYEACYLEGCNADHTWGDEHNESPLQIWREPEKTGRYVIGADVAEGLGGEGDFSVGFVLKVSQTGGIDEQVAMFRSNLTDTIAFAHMLNHLGRAYCGEDSGALIAVENNKYDTTLTHLCFQLQYPNLYRMKNINFMNPQTNKLGWSTQANSKPRLWQTFKRALQQKLVIVYSQVMAEEMKTFVKEDYSTRTTGSEGESHDDALMAGMIALYCAHENDWDDSVNQMNFRRELTLEEAAWHFSCDACSLIWPEAQTKDAQQCPRCKSRMIRATPNRDAVTADKQGNPFLAGDINRYEAQEFVVSMELSEKKMPEYEDL